MTLAADNARAILQAAVESEVGIVVDVDAMGEMIQPTTRAKQILYRFKQEDYDFHDLAIEYAPYEPDKALWVFKQSVNQRLRTKLGPS